MSHPPPHRPAEPISDEARLRSLRETLARTPAEAGIGVFAYGSLMWSPCFAFDDRRIGRVRDYHRGFSIWSVFARGTPDRPGLGFALEARAGALCEGVVYRLPPDTTEADLVPLWEREMWTDTYRPEWVSVETDAGEIMALTFVVSPGHPQYAGDLPIADKARYIAAASGKFGLCRDYLSESVAALRAHGIGDEEAEALLAEVERLGG